MCVASLAPGAECRASYPRAPGASCSRPDFRVHSPGNCRSGRHRRRPPAVVPGGVADKGRHLRLGYRLHPGGEREQDGSETGRERYPRCLRARRGSRRRSRTTTSPTTGSSRTIAKSFPGSALQIGETTLWPGTDLPFAYASFLQESAPGHWSVLTNPSYTHFGYYIGYGPTIVVCQPCPVTEFPGGQNIPALLASHGCQFHIEQTVWLVIEVGS